MDLHAFLNLFHPITDDDFRLLTEGFRTRTFKKGDEMVVPGQTQKELYFVKSGVQMSYFDTGDKTHVIAFTYAPGLCALPESFSLQQPSKNYLVSLTDTEVDYLTFDGLQQIFDRSHDIERLFRRITETVMAGILNRHVELHALSMEERYITFCRRSPHLLQLVPHKYIASYLDISPTNFSKLFNRVKF